MEYSSQTHSHASPLFRFSHGSRFRTTLALAEPRPGERLLDYGCGDGHLLSLMRGSGAGLFGFDPDPEMLAHIGRLPGVVGVADTKALPDHSFDKITCCEVLEHISDTETYRIMGECRRLIAPGGMVIVSVPLEVGPSAILKAAARRLTGQRPETNATPANILRSAAWRPVERLDYGMGYYGHIGFDYRGLERKFGRCGWRVGRRLFTPLPFGPVLNSQVFYLLRRAA